MAIDFEALYYRDPYQTEMRAQVLSCAAVKDGFEIVLDQTVFYPEGGGQPGDRGRIGDSQIVDTFYKDGKIVHLGTAALGVGSEVLGRIDFERRLDLMQQHSGEHIFSGLAHQAHGCENVGFHISETQMTMDYDVPLTWAEVIALERQANEVITQNLDIEIVYPDAAALEAYPYRSKREVDGQVRWVHIEGVDRCACCGTQLRHTGEIGHLLVRDLERYKGGVRLSLLCGRRASSYLRSLHDQASAMAKRLSCKCEDLDTQLSLLLDRQGRLSDKLRATLKAMVATLPEQGGIKLALLPEIEKEALRVLAKEVSESLARFAFFLTPSKGGYAFVMASQHEDLRPIFVGLQGCFELKGGGHQGFFQGQIEGQKEAIFRLVEEVSKRDS